MAGDEVTVLQLVGDTKQFERSIRKALGVVKGAERDMVAAFDKAGASMDGAGAKAGKLQKQIDALTGVNSGMKDRAADIEAYGAELDRLSAKYKPLFSAQQQYKKSLEEINQAARGGVLSEKERVAAIASTKAAFTAQVKNIRGVSVANDELTKTGGLARHELINLSRQIQDVGVSLFSGQSPFTVMVQQGSQIADIYGSSGTGTVGGSLKQIGSGIASVITPMRLLGVATAATGALALASLASWKSYALQLEDTAKSVGTATAELSKLQGAAAVRGISADDFSKGIVAFGRGVYEAKNNMGGLAEVFRANNVHASNFDDALGKAADLIKNARDDQQRLVLLQQMGLPPTMQWVRLLSGGADGIKAAKEAMKDFAGDDSMIRKAREIDEALNRIYVNFGRGWRDAIFEVIGFFDNLSNTATAALMRIPGIGRAIPTNILRNALNDSKSGYQVGSRLVSNSNVDSFYNGLGSNAPGNNRPAAGGTSVDKESLKNSIAIQQQYIGLLGQTATAADQVRAVELAAQSARLAGVPITQKQVDLLKQLAYEQGLGITAIKQQADSYRVEAGAIGMSVGQATAYVAAQNALNDARRNGRALTAQNIEDINKEAEALGRAAQAAAQKNLASDIKFDRSQIGLSDSEQSANARVRSVFGDNEINSAQAQFYKQQLLINDALRQYSDIGREAFKGIGADILAGKSAMESFGNALNRVAAKLLDMSIDRAFSGLFGGLGGGGLGGGLLSLLPKFASGTNFAPGGMALVGERGPELVNLPRGSQVIPNHELGGSSTSIVINNNTPAQVSTREVVDGRGNRGLQFTIDDAVAASMSRPGSATRGALRNNFGASPVGVRR